MDNSPPTVVVIDDAAEIRLLVRAQLRVSGRLQVVGEGADGADAVALARRHRPSLMLLDVSMPGKDGFEALPEVLAASPATKVVLYSGLEEQGLAEKALRLGAAAFVAKSAPVDTLVDRLVTVLGQDLAGHDATAQHATVEELRQSEERFRLLVEAVEDYAIFMLDPGGHIVSWNAGAQRIKGYTADEVIGRHFRVFYPPEVAARRHPEHELEVALREGHYEEEGWRLRKDGSRFWANVLITAVSNDEGEHVGFAKVTRDNSERRRLAQEREGAVEELAAANAELESLNKRLRAAAQEQAQFLAVTAHELRTPIGVIGGSAETLSRHWEALTDEERSDLLEAMTGSTARLRRLLADLLTASRLQASALEVTTEPVSVSAVVGDAVATVRRTWPDARVLAEVPDELVVAADRDRLAQAVDNLLSNALKHGRPPVRVSVRHVPGRVVEIRVSDEGSGVPEVMRTRLFERFATGARIGGTGLGLFIVRELARAHGGDAFYEPPGSAAPSGVFVISLPDRAE